MSDNPGDVMPKRAAVARPPVDVISARSRQEHPADNKDASAEVLRFSDEVPEQSRLMLYAAAMSVVGLAKRDPMIPVNVIRGGWRGYRHLPESRSDSRSRQSRLFDQSADVRG